MRPILASISRSALRHNLGVAKRYADGASVFAVVKAEAYGHGLRRAVSALEGAEGLALLEIESALLLREWGIQVPLLLLEGFFGEDELRAFSERGLTAVVHHEAQVRMLETERVAVPIDVFLKINTGMNRLGVAPSKAVQIVERLRACAAVGDIALMTHFADADGREGVAEQMKRLERTGISDLPRSLANSAALIRYPETRADWVRPGIMLYGCSPFPDVSADALGLVPAMTLTSQVIAAQDLRAGDRVGYGGTFTAKRPMRVGIVACGYADGYPRHAPGSDDCGTPIIVAGRRTRTVGRVSMDLLCVDLTSIAQASVGSEVTLWGEGLSADEVAAAAGTVSYELLCALAARVPVTEVD